MKKKWYRLAATVLAAMALAGALPALADEAVEESPIAATETTKPERRAKAPDGLSSDGTAKRERPKVPSGLSSDGTAKRERPKVPSGLFSDGTAVREAPARHRRNAEMAGTTETASYPTL